MPYNGIYLNLQPVCECGEILRDVYTCEIINRTESGCFYPTVKFEPVCCPFCGATIKGIQIRREYLDMFKG